jgi:hypothetical protein
MKPKIIDDPAIKSIRNTRLKIAAEFGHDADKYIDYLIERQKKHKSRLVFSRKKKSAA